LGEFERRREKFVRVWFKGNDLTDPNNQGNVAILHVTTLKTVLG